MPRIEGAVVLKLDFTKEASSAEILRILNGAKADVILSDMAPSASGHRDLDHSLLMASFSFSCSLK
jgi:23S rRNA (uridine2552-2'-O)-methyltransferase